MKTRYMDLSKIATSDWEHLRINYPAAHHYLLNASLIGEWTELLSTVGKLTKEEKARERELSARFAGHEWQQVPCVG